jgi:hypothetical protein
MFDFKHISASSFKAFHRCKRCWWFSKAIPRPADSEALVFGKNFHSQAEKVVGGGVPDRDFSHRHLLLAAKDAFFPQVWQKIEVEGKAEGLLPDGKAKYLGFIDLLYWEQGTPTICDHKTTGSWRWALKEEEIKKDPQMCLYAYHIMKRERKSEVFAEHIAYLKTFSDEYLSKTGKPSLLGIRKTRATIDEKTALQGISGMDDAFHEMKRLSRVEDPHSIPPSLGEACRMYGGCPYSTVCAEHL